MADDGTTVSLMRFNSSPSDVGRGWGCGWALWWLIAAMVVVE